MAKRTPKKEPVERNVYEARRKLSFEEIEKALQKHQPMSHEQADFVLSKFVSGYETSAQKEISRIKWWLLWVHIKLSFWYGVMFLSGSALLAIGITLVIALAVHLWEPINHLVQLLPQL